MRRVILALFFSLATAVLSRAAPLRGTVRDSVTGKPVPQARVELLQAAGTVITTTDDGGDFAVEVRESGPVTLAISHPGYQVARTALATLPKQPLAVELDPVISIADRIEVTATRAREGTDPVTVTNIPQEQIQSRPTGPRTRRCCCRASRPASSRTTTAATASATRTSRIRGFGQARTRVTLNGAPLNDAESGELFFIDLADFLSTAGDVQVQRGVFGLSGIGGAVDITTAPPSLRAAFTLQTGVGILRHPRRRRALRLRADRRHLGAHRALLEDHGPTATATSRGSTCGTTSSRSPASAKRSRLRLVLFGGPEQTHLAYDGDSEEPPSTVGSPATPTRDRRFNPLTYPGELDNFFQPHFQVVHDLSHRPRDPALADVLLLLRRRLLRPVQGRRRPRRVQPPRRGPSRRHDDHQHRPGAPAHRERVGRRLGPDPHPHRWRTGRSR